jgi:hypothetical protein
MNTHSTILDNASVEATTLNRILQAALAGQGNIREAVDQFNDQFTFTDHALGLEFKDKGRLTEFLAKIRELFPDSERKANTIFSSGDRVISESCRSQAPACSEAVIPWFSPREFFTSPARSCSAHGRAASRSISKRPA